MDFIKIKQQLENGISFMEIAKELGIPITTLKSRCYVKNIYYKNLTIVKNKINTSTHKKCGMCKEIKEKDAFYKRRDRNNMSTSYCKSCTNTLTLNRKRNLKKLCVEYKGSKCEICGYNRCIDALHFHHLDPSVKEFGIATLRSYTFSENVKKELDKCQLVCANCHNEIHFNLVR